VEDLEKSLHVAGGPPSPVEPFAAEAAEREAYREDLERLREYVSMGEGI
jgi:hypothetical protein